MKLHQLVTEKNILFYDKKKDKKGIIKDLLRHLWQNSNLKMEGIPEDELYTEFLAREKEQTTALGSGFAFPHVRINNLQGSYVLIAISRNGVDFDSMDNNPVNFLIITVVPRLKPAILLSFRAAIISILMNGDKKNAFLSADSPSQVYRMIEKEDKSLEKEILAKDIMRPVNHSLKPEMTLYNAARELHRNHVDSMPVIDSDGKLLGKLSCHDLFSYKLPEFFNTLHSISFIKYMNPFEKYFESDQTDILASLDFKEKTPFIKHDATLMEIVFDMTVKNNELLYVVDDGVLLGTIDRYSIIDKILISSLDGEGM